MDSTSRLVIVADPHAVLGVVATTANTNWAERAVLAKQVLLRRMQNHLNVSGTPHLKTLTVVSGYAGLTTGIPVGLYAALRAKVEGDDV